MSLKKPLLVNQLDYDIISLSEKDKSNIGVFLKKFGKKRVSEELYSLMNNSSSQDYYTLKGWQFDADNRKYKRYGSNFHEDAATLWKNKIHGFTKKFSSYKTSAENLLFLAQSSDFIESWNDYLKDKSEIGNNKDGYNAYYTWNTLLQTNKFSYTEIFVIFLDKYKDMKSSYNGENYQKLLFEKSNHIKNILKKRGIDIHSKAISSIFSSFYRTIDNFEYSRLQELKKIANHKHQFFDGTYEYGIDGSIIGERVDGDFKAPQNR